MVAADMELCLRDYVATKMYTVGIHNSYPVYPHDRLGSNNSDDIVGVYNPEICVIYLFF